MSEDARAQILDLKARMGRSIVGQEQMIERLLIGLIANGNLLVVPPVIVDSVAGLAVYPAPPRLEDMGGERGTTVTGRRTESVSYVATEEGSCALPPVAVDWWDWTSGRLRRAEAPGVAFTVVANPDLVREIELPPDSLDVAQETSAGPGAFGVDARVRRWVALIAAAIVTVGLAYRLLAPRYPRWRARLRDWQAARAESEAAALGRVRTAARSNDPRATANALAAWLHHFGALGGSGTVGELLEAPDDSALRRELQRLDATLYGTAATDPPAWSGGALCDHLAKARERIRHDSAAAGSPGQNAAGRTGPTALGPLNPKSS
jgi:hypothetical protein